MLLFPRFQETPASTHLKPALLGLAVLLAAAPLHGQQAAAPSPKAQAAAEAGGVRGIKFGEASFLNIGADTSEEVMQVVRLPILSVDAEAMNRDDLKITVRFVERTGYEETVKYGILGDEASVKFLWQSEPVDWEEDGAEELEIRCKYLGMGEIVGMVATLYYQGELQDAMMNGREAEQQALAQQLAILLANQQCQRLLKTTPFDAADVAAEPLPELAGDRYVWHSLKGAGQGDIAVEVSFGPAGRQPSVRVQQKVSGLDQTVNSELAEPPSIDTTKPKAQQDLEVKPPTVLEP